MAAVLEHVDRDQVLVHARCFGVDAGELVAARPAAVRLVVAVLVDLTRTFAAVTTVVVFEEKRDKPQTTHGGVGNAPRREAVSKASKWHGRGHHLTNYRVKETSRR